MCNQSHATVANGQDRWGVVENVWSNVFIQFFDMDVCHILNHRRPISCMEGDCMLGIIDKSLHERHLSLRDELIPASGVDKPHPYQGALGKV